MGYFWSTVEKMSAGDRCRLLKFVTGAERLPVYGFKYNICLYIDSYRQIGDRRVVS